MIYFVQAEIIGRIKIGFCSKGRWQKRLSQLQTGSAVPLSILVICPGTRRTEAKLHERFADLRALGEWFEPGKPLLRLIFRLQRKRPSSNSRKYIPRRIRSDAAADWLCSRFREHDTWQSEDLFQRAQADGISRCALFKAKLRHPAIVSRKVGRVWIWTVLSPPPATDASVATVLDSKGVTTVATPQVSCDS